MSGKPRRSPCAIGYLRDEVERSELMNKYGEIPVTDRHEFVFL